MTSPLKSVAFVFLAGAGLWTASPALALGPTERAIADCRAQALGQFGAGEIRSHRIGEIAGNSRSTRVTIYVTADRRYTFRCASDGQGRIVTAALSPAREGPQLASGQR